MDTRGREWGYRAQFTDSDFGRSMKLDVIKLEGPNEFILTGTDLTFSKMEEGVRYDGPTGIIIPHAMYYAIVEAIDPSPHKAEIRRLEDALQKEQERVDHVLGALWR